MDRQEGEGLSLLQKRGLILLRQSKEEIEYLYNRYTMSDCELILDSSHQAVSRLLLKYNIPARKRGAKPSAETINDFIDRIDAFYGTVPKRS